MINQKTHEGIKKCFLCNHAPTVTFNPLRQRWIVGCQCVRAVNLCDSGHPTYDDAVECWNLMLAALGQP